MGARTLALILAGLLGVYLLLLGRTGVLLLTSGGVAGFLLGLAVLVFPFVGAWIVWRELRFGFTAQQMSEQIDVDPDALEFDQVKAQIESSPEDWRAWYRAGVLYDVAGHRRESRTAMHQAAACFRRTPGAVGSAGDGEKRQERGGRASERED